MNYDMPASDLEKTDTYLRMKMTPDSVPSFLNDLVANLLQFVDQTEIRTPTGNNAPFNYRLVPYISNSDHMVFLAAGIPAMQFNHWPDNFYHSSADTADMTDPTEGKRIGFVGAAAFYYLATAGTAEAKALAWESSANGAKWITEVARQSVRLIAGDKGHAPGALRGGAEQGDRRVPARPRRRRVGAADCDGSGRGCVGEDAGGRPGRRPRRRGGEARSGLQGACAGGRHPRGGPAARRTCAGTGAAGAEEEVRSVLGRGTETGRRGRRRPRAAVAAERALRQAQGKAAVSAGCRRSKSPASSTARAASSTSITRVRAEYGNVTTSNDDFKFAWVVGLGVPGHRHGGRRHRHPEHGEGGLGGDQEARAEA